MPELESKLKLHAVLNRLREETHYRARRCDVVFDGISLLSEGADIDALKVRGS